MMVAVTVAIVITIMVVIAGVAVAMVAVVTVVIGARRRRNASQRCSERHRRYQGEKGFQVHMDAPCSRRNLRGCGRETRHRLSRLADAHVTLGRHAAKMSACGTFRTCRRYPKMSAHRGRPEVIDARPERRD
jgi:hypothetical protein